MANVWFDCECSVKEVIYISIHTFYTTMLFYSRDNEILIVNYTIKSEIKMR